MCDDNNGRTIVWFLQIFGLKKPLERFFFSKFFGFKKCLSKREIFVNFLPQKFMAKYGIVSTYSVNFVSQKLWPVSSAWGPLQMIPVGDNPPEIVTSMCDR